MLVRKLTKSAQHNVYHRIHSLIAKKRKYLALVDMNLFCLLLLDTVTSGLLTLFYLFILRQRGQSVWKIEKQPSPLKRLPVFQESWRRCKMMQFFRENFRKWDRYNFMNSSQFSTLCGKFLHNFQKFDSKISSSTSSTRMRVTFSLLLVSLKKKVKTHFCGLIVCTFQFYDLYRDNHWRHWDD